MYELIFLVYLGNVIDALKTVSSVILGLGLVIWGIGIPFLLQVHEKAVYSEKDEEEWKKLFLKFNSIMKKIVFIAGALTIFLPSKTVIYSLAAVKTADIAYHSNKHIPKIVDDTLILIEKKLQQEIKKIDKE